MVSLQYLSSIFWIILTGIGGPKVCCNHHSLPM